MWCTLVIFVNFVNFSYLIVKIFIANFYTFIFIVSIIFRVLTKTSDFVMKNDTYIRTYIRIYVHNIRTLR